MNVLEIVGLLFFLLGVLMLIFWVYRIVLSFGGNWPLYQDDADIRDAVNKMPDEIATLVTALYKRGIDITLVLNSPGLLFLIGFGLSLVGGLIVNQYGPNPWDLGF